MPHQKKNEWSDDLEAVSPRRGKIKKNEIEGRSGCPAQKTKNDAYAMLSLLGKMHALCPE